MMNFESVDEDYVKTFQMQMASGRFFSAAMASDSLSAVVNETAASVMGMQSPVGQWLGGRGKKFTIIGVVKDFNFKSVRTKIEPLVLLKNPSQCYAMVIKTKSEGISRTIGDIEKVYKTFNAQAPFYFNFLSEDYDQLYRTEERVGRIAEYFTFLGIFVATLGLYGLASFTTERRTKEIGIRKVLGASVSGLVGLLTKEFLALVLAASLIAWPITYLLMRRWLEEFAYRTSMGIWIFVSATAVALVIAFATVSYQAIRIVLANPVEALRYE